MESLRVATPAASVCWEAAKLRTALLQLHVCMSKSEYQCAAYTSLTCTLQVMLRAAVCAPMLHIQRLCNHSLVSSKSSF